MEVATLPTDMFRVEFYSKITEKTGNVIGVKAVNDDNEIMMITNAGIIIQLRMDEITIHGRVTSGVKMINLDKGVTVAKIAKVREKISDGDHDIDNIDDVSEEVEEENITTADDDEE